jgi:FKBP-type peptidyl-prolyl cis-trans isomerase
VGNSSFPSGTSKLTVNYTGRFLNGKIFDQSKATSSGLPAPFQTPLSNLIQGWQIVFSQYVAKGGKATFYLPSGLAYGSKGSGSIPPNSNLIFEVELIGFTN